MKRLICSVIVLVMVFCAFSGNAFADTGSAELKEGDVLYETDFSDGLPDGFRIPQGHEDKVRVEDGFLYLDAVGREFTKVLLPAELDEYGDYEITIHATLYNQRDAARWGSIMYRIQNESYPYYQMCFRVDSTAANGVEFALRTPQNTWSVTSKGPLANHVFSAGTLDEVKVRIKGEHAVHSINGAVGVDCEDAATYKTGAIGLQANYCIMKVADIKVTYLSPAKQSAAFITPAQSDLGVIGGYTLSEYIQTKQRLNALATDEAVPANAIFRVDKDLNVTDAAGAAFATVDEALTALGNKIMPTFKIADTDTADSLCDYLENAGVRDVFIMSENGDAVAYARNKYKICRGVLDLTAELSSKESLTTEELLSIRARTNSCFASVVVIPDNVATASNVKYLYDRLIAVWVGATEPVQTAAEAFYIAAAGAHGAITDNTALMYDVIGNYMSGSKLFRVPLNIGHRGLPSRAPENTVEGSLYAYELGADCIENDIYLTKDGELAVMHDATTNRTTNGNLTVEDSTLQELKELLVNKQFPNKAEYAECRIPSLQDYYEAFKGKDVQLFVEFKSASRELVEKFYQLTKQYGMEDQVSVITFNETQINNLKEIYPEMSAGYLCNGLGADITDGDQRAKTVLSKVQQLKSTYNPSYSGHNTAFAKSANMRGLTVWPWTIDSYADFNSFFMGGYNGLTTNNCTLASKFAKLLTPSSYEYEIMDGAKFSVCAQITLYNRTEKDVSSAVRVIPLEGNITVGKDNALSFDGPGVYSYALEYEYKINSNNKYTLYTQPITVTVKEFVPIAGDADRSGAADNKDVVALFRYLSGCGEDINLAVLDVNGDGKVGNKDVTVLFRYVSGADVVLTEPKANG